MIEIDVKSYIDKITRMIHKIILPIGKKDFQCLTKMLIFVRHLINENKNYNIKQFISDTCRC